MRADQSEVPIVDSSGEAEAVAGLLERKLYEFNVGATGFADGKGFCFTARDNDGEIVAGVAGYSWGGDCHVRELWVAEEWRRRGIGSALLVAVEREAGIRNCRYVRVSTHSFQAPEFYTRLGYVEVARIAGDPIGHANIFLAKALVRRGRSSIPVPPQPGSA